MNRRQLLMKSALAMGAFALSRDLYAHDEERGYLLNPVPNPGKPVKLNANENPHGPSPKSKQAMVDAVAISNR